MIPTRRMNRHPSLSNDVAILAGNNFAMQHAPRAVMAVTYPRRNDEGRLPVTANGLPDRHIRRWRTFIMRLGTDGDAVLDIVEHVLRNHVLSHQLTLYSVRAVAHDPVGHILADAQREDQIRRRHFIDIEQ